MKPQYNFSTSLISESKLRELSVVSPWKGILAIAGEWIVIISCVVFHKMFPNPWVYLFVWFVISSRLYAIYSLLHDAIHYSVSRNKTINNFLGQFFLAFPLFVSLSAWRKNHLNHHKYLQTERDPEYIHLSYDEFQFPKSKWELGKIILGDISGVNFLYYKLKKILLFLKHPLQIRLNAFLTFLAILPVVFILVYFGLAKDILIYWIIPYITLFQLLSRIRLSTEHLYVEERYPLKTRTVTPSFMVKVLLTPHNIGYHTEHHLFPSVPFYNLPRLHELLAKNEAYTSKCVTYSSYRELMHIFIK